MINNDLYPTRQGQRMYIHFIMLNLTESYQ